MATKKELFGLKDKQQCFDIFSTDKKNQYSNLNLNQNNKYSILNPVQTFNKSNNDEICGKKCDAAVPVKKYREKEKLHEWNKPSKTSNFSFLNEKKEDKQHWKNEMFSNATTNNSILSFHIEAYENSADANSFGDKMNKTLKNSGSIKNEIFTASKFVIQDPFEFPRQQNDDVKDPEMSQFKASQQLLNNNQASNNRSQQDQFSTFKEICSATLRLSGSTLRIGLQYGFMPLVIYLGFKRGGQLPTGEPVELGFTSLLWG